MSAQGAIHITLGLTIFRWYPTTFIPLIEGNSQKYILIGAWLFAVPYDARLYAREVEEQEPFWDSDDGGGRVTANEFAV